jgi:hypothetical protein
LLALAPALVRRYDATERLVAERAQSTARVLDRNRRRRTVPLSSGPVHLPRPLVVDAVAPISPAAPARRDIGRAEWVPIGSASAPRARRPATRTVRPAPRRPVQRPESPAKRPTRRRQSPAVYRRRRVLAVLVLLNVIELVGVFAVSSGFWTGFAATGVMLAGYVVHLRNAALADARTRRVEARRAEVLAVRQAEIRREQTRRHAARREALRRAAAARATAQRDAQRLSQRYVDYDPQRGARVRGRSYDTGKAAGF